jgi:hypothetical protein
MKLKNIMTVTVLDFARELYERAHRDPEFAGKRVRVPNLDGELCDPCVDVSSYLGVALIRPDEKDVESDQDS